ncbi:reverse transcriptase [Phytophthora megakarya]|uniref:Reverse transcriptase n=1 Tax=Phytophthora megakarya TaxID=4795 RepID=A0A225WEC3_9STRA|nr:reverse transcriptase [Phytophthora megakarya]
MLMLADHKPFHVVCDASEFAIGCALMQFDDEGRERVGNYQPRQLKPAERNYPVHDNELLAMRYALIKFRITRRCGQRRMPTSVPAHGALSRRPNYVQSGRHVIGDEDDDECAVCIAEGAAAVEVTATSTLRDSITSSYEADASFSEMIKYLKDPSDTARRRLTSCSRARIDRYTLDGSLLTYCIDRADSPRVVVPLDDELRARLIQEFHDTPSGGLLGCEKTSASWPEISIIPTCTSGSGSGCARMKRANV